jgi:hypothetical protein
MSLSIEVSNYIMKNKTSSTYTDSKSSSVPNSIRPLTVRDDRNISDNTLAALLNCE